MTFFERLKEFIKVDLKLDIHDLIHINIIRIEGQPPVKYQKDKKSAVINLEALDSIQQDRFKSMLPPAVKEEGILYLDEKVRETVEKIDIEEGLEDGKKLLKFYKDKIPPDDYSALRASLYLKQKFKEHASREEIYAIRNQIITTFPEHGENISKLCSSGYFETWIKRVYEIMSGTPGFKNEDFIKRFNLFVEEGGFAVFVSEKMTSSSVIKAIEEERATQIKYGVADPSVIIHAIGRNNIENANMAIYDLKTKYSHLSVYRTDDMNIYFARIKFN